MSERTAGSLLTAALTALLGELLDGPPDYAFVLNPGDEGLLKSLARLSASEASARPGGRSSVASHVHHLQYGLGLMNEWVQGRNAFDDANYSASWTHQEVTEAEWRALRETLERNARQWRAGIGVRAEDDLESAKTAAGNVVHLAYHLGAIRQLTAAAAGPRAAD
jgi:hypothetical protein